MDNDHPIKILFLAADPSDKARLRLGQELRDIRERLQLSKYRDKFVLESRESLRPGDISQAIFDTEPQIVHFSGHGESVGELLFEDAMGKTQAVQPNALADFFKLMAEQISCVVLNACYSEIQAKAIATHIPFVIGIKQSIGDRAAITFSAGFYKAMGANRPIEEAFNFGCAEIGMEGISEALIPVLFIKEKPVARVKYTLVLRATLDDLDQKTVDAIMEHLRQVSGDASLTLNKIESGSVKLSLEGFEDGSERIEAALKSGELEEILDIPVQMIAVPIQSVESSINDRSYTTDLEFDEYQEILRAVFQFPTRTDILWQEIVDFLEFTAKLPEIEAEIKIFRDEDRLGISHSHLGIRRVIMLSVNKDNDYASRLMIESLQLFLVSIGIHP